MGDKTGIEWTDATWNPTVGCSRASPGCDHCYAETMAATRLAHTAGYAGITEHGHWTGDVRALPERLDQPLRWSRPRRIFVNSMSDLFHPKVPDATILAVWSVMARARQHTFQVLTKRPKRMARFSRRVSWDMNQGGGWDPERPYLWPVDHDRSTAEEPLPNVWLGTSIETGDYEWRAAALADTNAAVRFVSAEPLLGPVSLCRPGRPLDWVIVGGESGPGARPMHPDWARALRDECTRAGVPFLFKQWGEWAPIAPVYGVDEPSGRDGFDVDAAMDRYDVAAVAPSGHVCQAFPAGKSQFPRTDHQPCPDAFYMAKVGKRIAGRELDGRTWDEYPTGGRE